jgi:hypothetical protein
MKFEIDWPVLKRLYELYDKRCTTAAINKADFVQFLIHQKRLVSFRYGNPKVLIAEEGYEEFFRKHLLKRFDYYQNFFLKAGLPPDARKKFTEPDIRTLMLIWENRLELAKNITNIEDFSSKVFEYGGSKYLKSKLGLCNAVLKILSLEKFPQSSKENQWRFVVDNPNAEAVIFCENRSFLKQPWLASELRVKLWHVGGNNIAIVDDIDDQEFTRPIYYSCDWDYHGLSIYTRIKRKLSSRQAGLQLLVPRPPQSRLPVNSFAHRSQWAFDKPFSGLDISDFKPRELKLILELIATNSWIEEESNSLAEMFFYTQSLGDLEPDN